MSDINAEEIVSAFNQNNIDVDEELVAEKYEEGLGFQLSPSDAARLSIKNAISEGDYDIEADSVINTLFAEEFTPIALGDIRGKIDEEDEEEIWVDVAGEVVELWEPRSDTIAQVGLIGDDSGRMKFVMFTTSKKKGNLPTLEEGDSIEAAQVVTDVYEEKVSVKFNSNTTITKTDEEYDVPSGAEEKSFVGEVVNMKDKAGLINRCPEDDCSRVVESGRCPEHGQVEGEHDTRIMAVLDDGHRAVNVVINDGDLIESLFEGTDVPASLEDAQAAAKDALDTTVVRDAMFEHLHGRTLEVDGFQMGSYLVVEEAEDATVIPDVDGALVQARSA